MKLFSFHRKQTNKNYKPSFNIEICGKFAVGRKIKEFMNT